MLYYLLVDHPEAGALIIGPFTNLDEARTWEDAQGDDIDTVRGCLHRVSADDYERYESPSARERGGRDGRRAGTGH